MEKRLVTEVQRFRPYVVPGGHFAQVRLNPHGMYVRWQDYERLREALEVLLPGLVLDLRYASDDDDKDAMRSRVETVQQALSSHTDWDQVFRGTSSFQGCVCYAYEGDGSGCPQHSDQNRSAVSASVTQEKS
jgi:hypothetical protein